MLGAAIAARPLARNGLGLLSSALGRTRLAEAPLLASGRMGTRIADKESGATAARGHAAQATRP